MRNIATISVLLLLIVCLAGCGSEGEVYLLSTEQEYAGQADTEPAEAVSTDMVSETEKALFFVYVCGEVHAPGVYALPQGSRICDAVEAAGGLTEEASSDYWNLAEVLSDGQMICFPTKEEASERQKSREEEDAVSDGKVNINTAGKEQLMTIPGVGETRAAAILAYRSDHGAFSNTEEIMQVSGIKDALYARMREYITVD